MRKLVLMVALAACHGPPVRGSGKAAHQERTVAPFDAIDVRDALSADIAIGSALRVTIDGDDNLVPLVKTEVADHRLRLSTDRSYSTQLSLAIHIVTPSLAAVELAGVANATLTGFTGGDLRLRVGDAGAIHASGSANEVDIELSGAGSVDTRALQAARAKVNVAGAGTLDVFASQALTVQLSGAGTIRYYGHPPEVDKHVSGAGTIEAR